MSINGDQVSARCMESDASRASKFFVWECDFPILPLDFPLSKNERIVFMSASGLGLGGIVLKVRRDAFGRL